MCHCQTHTVREVATRRLWVRGCQTRPRLDCGSAQGSQSLVTKFVVHCAPFMQPHTHTHTVIECMHQAFGRFIGSVPDLYEKMAVKLREKQVHPDALWTASKEEQLAELFQVSPAGQPTPTTFWSAMTVVQRENLKGYEKVFKESGTTLDPRLWVAVAHKSHVSHSSKTNCDGTLPTYLASGTQKLYSFSRDRWLLAKEKIGSFGMAASAEVAAVLRTPPLSLQRRELHHLIGNAWHMGNACMVLLAALGSVEKHDGSESMGQFIGSVESWLQQWNWQDRTEVWVPADGRCFFFVLYLHSLSAEKVRQWRERARNQVGVCTDQLEHQQEVQALSAFTAPLEQLVSQEIWAHISSGHTATQPVIRAALKALGLRAVFWTVTGSPCAMYGEGANVVHLQMCRSTNGTDEADHYNMLILPKALKLVLHVGSCPNIGPKAAPEYTVYAGPVLKKAHAVV